MVIYYFEYIHYINILIAFCQNDYTVTKSYSYFFPKNPFDGLDVCKRQNHLKRKYSFYGVKFNH